MYVEHGHGEQILDDLQHINTEEEYRDYIVAFNNENFNYSTEAQDSSGFNYFNNSFYYKGVGNYTTIENVLDFTKNYFDNWFSDYVYIKNISNEVQYITCEYDIDEDYTKEKVEVEIEPNGVIVLDFGTLVKEHSTGYRLDLKDEFTTRNKTFDGYWEMTNSGIIIYDTDNHTSYDLTEVDSATLEHIVDYVRDGYIRGDLYEVYIEE